MSARTIASLIVLAMAGALGACATAPEGEQPAPGVERRDAPGQAARPVESKPIARADVTGRKTPAPGAPGAPMDAARAPEKRSVYFDFDRFDIKEEYRPVVQAHAKYLRENRAKRMLIQGHADERGSREYNIGLGQRRSDSVKNMLVLLGAGERQIEAVSLGEEKPVCTEHDESCWWRNRRAEMLYADEL